MLTREHFRPEMGRGITKWRRGRLKPVSVLSKLNLTQFGSSVTARDCPVPGRNFVVEKFILIINRSARYDGR